MSEAKHSPLPWRVVPLFWDAEADVFSAGDRPLSNSWFSAADANLIVRAVNNHGKLLMAVGRFLAVHGAAINTDTPDGEVRVCECEACVKGRAAIAAASGEGRTDG